MQLTKSSPRLYRPPALASPMRRTTGKPIRLKAAVSSCKELLAGKTQGVNIMTSWHVPSSPFHGYAAHSKRRSTSGSSTPQRGTLPTRSSLRRSFASIAPVKELRLRVSSRPEPTLALPLPLATRRLRPGPWTTLRRTDYRSGQHICARALS